MANLQSGLNELNAGLQQVGVDPWANVRVDGLGITPETVGNQVTDFRTYIEVGSVSYFFVQWTNLGAPGLKKITVHFERNGIEYATRDYGLNLGTGQGTAANDYFVPAVAGAYTLRAGDKIANLTVWGGPAGTFTGSIEFGAWDHARPGGYPAYISVSSNLSAFSVAVLFRDEYGEGSRAEPTWTFNGPGQLTIPHVPVSMNVQVWASPGAGRSIGRAWLMKEAGWTKVAEERTSGEGGFVF